ALQAATAAIQGLAGGNMGQALAGGASPYLAGVIKDLTTDPKTHQVDVVTNTLAHAILGAVAAEVSGNNALAGAAGAAGGELAARELMKHIHGENAKVSDLSEEEKQTISTLSTLAAGLAGGIAGDSTASAVTGAQAGKNAAENNYLSSEQIDDWSTEMKSCQAGGGDCGGIIKKYEELSTAQQKQLISDCAANPASCQQKYGDVLTDSLTVKQAIDRALGEDIPIKMVYDLTATFAQQMQAEGVVATNKVSEALQKEYGLDEVQAGIVASAAASAFGGISKAGNRLPPINSSAKIATGQSVGSFEKSLVGLPSGERVAIVKQTAAKVIVEQGMVKDSKLTQMNGGRDVYKGKDGNLYALDTQHGRFEVVSPKGKHLGEVDFSMQMRKSADTSGSHNLKVK
ncbi:VENN motif pre-toxin domain-containing protein, partial [Photorhabdus bodei]